MLSQAPASGQSPSWHPFIDLKRGRSIGSVARYADYLPVVILDVVGLPRLRGRHAEMVTHRQSRHQRGRLRLTLSLRWPLGTPPEKQAEREALLARVYREANARTTRLRHLIEPSSDGMAWAGPGSEASNPSHGGGNASASDPSSHRDLQRTLLMWAQREERAALARYFEREEHAAPESACQNKAGANPWSHLQQDGHTPSRQNPRPKETP